MNSIKRVAAINDLSGFGRCSLTVAIPVISTFGIQVCPLPTAVLSAHTGFEGFTFHDLTAEMKKVSDHWLSMGINFDCIYSGFLGSPEQIDIVSDFCDRFGRNALKIIDPVMGDNGIIYRTYNDEMCNEMRRLVSKADVITPNLTEAAILLNEEYPKNGLYEALAKEWLSRLSKLGASKVVITGILQNGRIHNIGIDKNNNEFFDHSFEFLQSSCSGTGDIFASCITGYLLSGYSFNEAVYKSGKFVFDCLNYSVQQGDPRSEGIRFEPLLKNLSD